MVAAAVPRLKQDISPTGQEVKVRLQAGRRSSLSLRFLFHEKEG